MFQVSSFKFQVKRNGIKPETKKNKILKTQTPHIWGVFLACIDEQVYFLSIL
ncbi:hypothetical protein NU08_3346 [Flavobacterium anhuiense]|uniref:Uncharacterized protein n=1 Tax=Flavobacterium anhuiense TaxID=459526 RepID=A0A444VV50_9FLAO|nr:hypothetical protein NU08_3346 [Flavobacterium anhuiense]